MPLWPFLLALIGLTVVALLFLALRPEATRGPGGKVFAFLLIFLHEWVAALIPLPLFLRVGIAAALIGIALFNSAQKMFPARRRFEWARPREIEPQA